MLGLCGALCISRTPAQARSHDAKRPNILLVIADDWSYGHAGAYGCRWINTPAFDRVAREGVLFPSLHQQSQMQPLPGQSFNRPQYLAARGSDVPFWCFSRKWPVILIFWSKPATRSAIPARAGARATSRRAASRAIPPGRRTSSTSSSPRFRAWAHRFRAELSRTFLEERKPGQPFCFWLGGHEPHRPYEEGVRPSRRPRPGECSLPPTFPIQPSFAATCSTTLSKSSVSISTLAKSSINSGSIGELDDTLIVVTSDHGMPFPRVKGQIYEAGFPLADGRPLGPTGQAGTGARRFYQRARPGPHVPRGRRTDSLPRR